jgi:solute carrier family 25 oxoglutarate transporter 11
MALNLGMLAPYDQCKELISRNLTVSQQNNNLMSSAIAGFLAAGFSLPFDNAKTKMQKMVKNA